MNDSFRKEIIIFYIRKTAGFLVTVFVISVITFAAFQILPGDPALVILGVDAEPAQIENLRSIMHLDLSPVARYFLWISNALKGDFGQSFRYQRSVNSIIFSSFLVTVQLSVLVLLITILLGIPLGIFLARHDKEKKCLPVNFISQLGISFPVFCVALLFIYVFSVKLKLLPSMGYVSFSKNPFECIKSLLLPSLSLAFGTVSIMLRYMRSSILTQVKKDFVRTARSKGMGEKSVYLKHVLRNSLIPVITILGMLTSEILGGSIIIENVFSLPGIGKMISSSISSRDFPLIQALVLYLAFIVVSCNFAVDIFYSIVDPRIRLRGKSI
ncbi:MAG: ABC transporter permease [Treponema sp.]|nr:ABC transporter permease [Treponema sp.]